MTAELPPGFTARDDLEQIKVTVFCWREGCTAETPCADCREILTGEPQ